MGVFDFVKEAGAKVGIGESQADKTEKSETVATATAERAAEVAKQIQERRAAAKAAEAAKATRAAEVAQARQERMEQLAESKKARGLEDYVRKMGLEVEGLDVRFDDGLATVSGTAADQGVREKVILAIGNTEGVAQVHDEITVAEAAPAPESEMYVVVSGDTLGKIAKAYYGDAGKYPVIFEANRPLLTDPDRIYPGQVLRIPAAT